MKPFEWAVNPIKLQRAQNAIAKWNELNPTQKKELSDENVKAEYVKLGGLLVCDAPKEVQTAIEEKRVEEEVREIVKERRANKKK